MNNQENTTEQVKSPVVTFSNIPLEEETAPVGYDALPPEAFTPQTVTVVDVQFKKGGKVYFFDPGKLAISTGDEVIIDTARGAEYGFCAGGNHEVPQDSVVPPLRSVIRVATEGDKRTRKEYKAKEEAAFETCQKKIQEHKLDMKLVSSEYSFDGSKIVFYFTADGRVDFRDLVKDLAGMFRTRIELRQIGVRDEAKMLGGLGICGRPFCCKQFLDDFQPVSIKMAKTQNLSLNPTKISGTCGRLMCCLKYEQDAYEDLIKTSPKQDSVVNTCDGMGTVTETNLLKQTVKVRLDRDTSSVKTFQNSDICIIRNGKAKKNDPPIPTDLPPLPKPEKKQPEPDEITMFDESTLFGFTGSSDSAGERPERTERKRPARAEQKSGETRHKSRHRSDRRKSGGGTNGSNGNNGNNARTQQAGAQNQKTAPKDQKESGTNSGSTGSGGGSKSRSARRRHYRGQKRSSGGQKQENG